MMNRRSVLKLAAAAALPSLLLTGCAHPQLLGAGMTESAVRAKLGKPDVRTELPDGTVRLVYSYQPMGLEVWWVYFDRNGVLLRTEQALTEENFYRVLKTGMKIGETRELFGPCAQNYDFVLLKQSADMYRYSGPFRTMGLWIQYDRSGVVTEWAMTDDPWETRGGDIFSV